jgi:glucose/arabinose dehydrogenase
MRPLLRPGALLWLLAATPIFASILYAPVADPSRFRETNFAAGLALPQAMQRMSDGSILVQTSPGGSTGQLLRFTDALADGIADGPGTSVFNTSAQTPAQTGPLTQLVTAGSNVIQGSYGDHTISILNPGATPSSPMSLAGKLQFDYGQGVWWHDTLGLATRPTPGSPGSYDLVFNVGSQFDNQTGTDHVAMSGLLSGSLEQQSLYMVTLDLTGATPVASNLRKVAAGIRNVFGIAFHPDTGDLYFTDNAMDGTPFPPQADELNRIAAADVGVVVSNFGFPTCYPDYFTGALVGSGCVAPLAAFTPAGGMRSQGAAQIAFAPSSFPTGFNNGLFIGFAGDLQAGPTLYDPVLYYSFGTGTFVDFIAEGTLGRPIGLMSTSDSLFISDFTTGTVYQLTSAVPEPGAGALTLLALGLGVIFKCRS